MYRDIIELINEKKFGLLKERLMEIRPADIAELIDELEKKDKIILFRLLPKDIAADVFSFLSTSQRKDIVDAMHETQLNEIIDELYFDDKIDFLEEMPANFVKKILSSSTEEERKLINQFLSYPESSAGSIMTIEYVDLKKEMTVKEALQHIKETGVDKETIYICYVMDAKRKLEGIISLRKLVLYDENLLVGDIMEKDFIATTTMDDQEAVADLFKKYDLLALPVVDKEGRLVGIITIDDIVDVIEQENTEDFQIMAGMEPSEEEYIHSNVISLVKRRAPWLLILMLSATITERIVGVYDEVLQSITILAASIPMLMDTGGNAGSQSSTLIIRGLALGEVDTRDYMKVVGKELRVGLLVGFFLGSVNLLRMLLFSSAGFMVSFVVSITLISTVIIAKVVGGVLPMVAKKLKLDPAIMAGPLITTIVDALTLFIYFNVASALLNI